MRKNEKRRKKYFPKCLMLLAINSLPPDSTPTASMSKPEGAGSRKFDKNVAIREFGWVFGPNRDKRLQRRQEADDFRRIFQPLSLFFGVMGLLLLGWVGLTRLEGQPLKREMVGAALTLMSFPVLVFFFRFRVS